MGSRVGRTRPVGSPRMVPARRRSSPSQVPRRAQCAAPSAPLWRAWARPQEVQNLIVQPPFTEPPGWCPTPSRAGLVETSRRNRGTRGGFQKGTLPIVPGLGRPLTGVAVHLYPIRVGRLLGVTPHRLGTVRGHSRGLSSRSSRDGRSHVVSRSLIALARARRRRGEQPPHEIRTRPGRTEKPHPLEYGHPAIIRSTASVGWWSNDRCSAEGNDRCPMRCSSSSVA
jgi:hypothetical protein